MILLNNDIEKNLKEPLEKIEKIALKGGESFRARTELVASNTGFYGNVDLSMLHAALKESGIDFNAVNYYVDLIPKTKLKELIKKMGIPAAELIRKKEPIYQDLKLGQKKLSDQNERGFKRK